MSQLKHVLGAPLYINTNYTVHIHLLKFLFFTFDSWKEEKDLIILFMINYSFLRID